MKKILSLATAALLLAGSLISCGGKTGGSSDTIKIGGVGPTTGGAASYGTSVKNGASLAVKEINDAGGVNGLKLELSFEDDENDPEKAVNAYNKLKDSGMQILMGTVTSTPCKAVKDNAHDDNMFLLTPSGSAVECTKYDNAFRICFNDPDQFAADGYDAVYTIKAALEKANVTDANISASDLCDKLKAVMTEITVDGVTGSMTWNAEGEPTKEPKAMYIQDGAYKAMD